MKSKNINNKKLIKFLFTLFFLHLFLVLCFPSKQFRIFTNVWMVDEIKMTIIIEIFFSHNYIYIYIL